MASFADLTARLNLNIANFASNIQKASTQANSFASTLSGSINKGMVDPAKKSKVEFKDVARIVQGIIISKVFYSGLNAIRSATNAVWEFSQELEYAQMVYTNLFGSTEMATEFINVLKDFAAVTPFSFQQSEAAAKRLLAYGIQYQNVMYVMKGVLAAATVQGNDQAIESISRALGQIYTKGTLKAEEMRQLAEAGIPAWEILREKLGLTADQLARIGDLGIPADVAINALVDGINERFGSTLEQSSQTTKGLISNIKDIALMLAAGIFEPLNIKIRSALSTLEAFLSKIYDIYQIKGLGGVFEELVPPELQEAVRVLIANLSNLWAIIKSIASSLSKDLIVHWGILIQTLNVLLPILNMVLSIFAAMLKAITSNATLMKVLSIAVLTAAGMWAVYRAQAILAAATSLLIRGIVVAIKGLVIALNFLVAHPIWALLAVGVGLLIALSGASNKFAKSIRDAVNSFTSLGGVDPDKILLPDTKERTGDLSKFNNALGDTSNAMDDLADSTGDATKAAKGLLGFDEVFSLKSPDETSSAATDWSDYMDNLGDLSGIGDIDTSDLWEPTDFDGAANDFVGNLIDALGGKESLLSAGIGALLGAAIGALIGGPLGAQIGAILGALAGWFWPKVADALGLTDVGTVALPIAAGLGAAIGFIVGGPAGMAIGAAIGLLVGWLVDQITAGIETGDWSGFAMPLGIGIGAALGMVIGGPAGAAVGAAIGGLVGWIADLLIDGFDNADWHPQQLGMSIGGATGLAIGAIAGGPIGAVIGLAVGAFIGWLIGLIVDNWDAVVQWFKNAWDWVKGLGASIGDFFANMGAGIGTFVNNFVTGISNTFGPIIETIGGFFGNIGASVSRFFSAIGTAVSTGWSVVYKFFAGIISNVSDFISNLINGISEGFSTIIGTIGTFFSTLWASVSEWASTTFGPFIDAVSNLATVVSGIFSDIGSAIGTVFSDIATAFMTVATQLGETASTIFSFLYDLITTYVGGALEIAGTFFNSIWETITTIFSNIISSISTFFSTIWTAVSTWFSNIFTSFTTWISSIWGSLTTWLANNITAIATFLSNALSSVGSFFSSIFNSIASFFSTVLSNFMTWLSTMWSSLISWLTNNASTIASFFSTLISNIGSFFSSIFGTVGSFFSTIASKVLSFISSTASSIGSFFSNMISSAVNFGTNMVNSFAGWLSNAWSTVVTGVTNIYHTFTNFISNLWNNVFGKLFSWIDSGISKLREFFGLNDKASATKTVGTYSSGSSSSSYKYGHASGGIFNREHVAKFAEGNKAEAVIPLENAAAMQPFVTAVSDGIASSLMPIVASMMSNSNGNNSEQLRPLYLGTLVADERGLKELNRKMQVIELEENARRGHIG